MGSHPLPPGAVTGATEVTFPAGSTADVGRVLATVELADGLGLISDRTPFHPEDPWWPDQPGDRGSLTATGAALVVADSRTGVVDPACPDRLFLGADVPPRRLTGGWWPVVVHVLESAVGPEPGAEVGLRVDAGRRRRLSIAHTGSHLVALALNRALAARWRRVPRRDSLGSPDFDAAAIESSRIDEAGSLDVYRIGRSLRRAGFTPFAEPAELEPVEAAVREALAGWLAARPAVWVDTDGRTLADRRRWRCALPARTAVLECGGTHPRSLAELGGLRVELTLADGAVALSVRSEPGGR